MIQRRQRMARSERPFRRLLPDVYPCHPLRQPTKDHHLNRDRLRVAGWTSPGFYSSNRMVSSRLIMIISLENSVRFNEPTVRLRPDGRGILSESPTGLSAHPNRGMSHVSMRRQGLTDAEATEAVRLYQWPLPGADCRPSRLSSDDGKSGAEATWGCASSATRPRHRLGMARPRTRRVS